MLARILLSRFLAASPSPVRSPPVGASVGDGTSVGASPAGSSQVLLIGHLESRDRPRSQWALVRAVLLRACGFGLRARSNFHLAVQARRPGLSAIQEWTYFAKYPRGLWRNSWVAPLPTISCPVCRTRSSYRYRGGYLVEAHLLEKRPVGELAEAHGVHRSWIYKLLARYEAEAEGDAGLEAALAAD